MIVNYTFDIQSRDPNAETKNSFYKKEPTTESKFQLRVYNKFSGTKNPEKLPGRNELLNEGNLLASIDF